MDRGERDLAKLLANLEPVLSPERYSFEITDRPEFDGDTFALVREDEGIIAIRATPSGEWARISLGVHSSLEAVGLTAAFSRALRGRHQAQTWSPGSIMTTSSCSGSGGNKR